MGRLHADGVVPLSRDERASSSRHRRRSIAIAVVIFGCAVALGVILGMATSG